MAKKKKTAARAKKKVTTKAREPGVVPRIEREAQGIRQKILACKGADGLLHAPNRTALC